MQEHKKNIICKKCNGTTATDLYGSFSCCDCGFILNQKQGKKEYMQQLKEWEENRQDEIINEYSEISDTAFLSDYD